MATRGEFVLMPEWLSGMTRNHVGFARAGSNPAEHETFPASSDFILFFKSKLLFVLHLPFRYNSHAFNFHPFL